MQLAQMREQRVEEPQSDRYTSVQTCQHQQVASTKGVVRFYRAAAEGDSFTNVMASMISSLLHSLSPPHRTCVYSTLGQELVVLSTAGETPLSALHVLPHKAEQG